jgi:hypothetical protein
MLMSLAGEGPIAMKGASSILQLTTALAKIIQTELI